MNSKTVQHRSAEALVATFVQMSRSAELARWLQQTRQRTLENRVRRTSDARELVKLQLRLDAQQSQAAVLEAATTRFRNQAPNLAQFTKAGLTMEDFERLGVHHVIAPERLASEIERLKTEESAAAHPPAKPRGSAVAHPPAKPRGRSHHAKAGVAAPAPSAAAAAQPLAANHAPSHPAAKRAPRKRGQRHKDKGQGS